MKVMGMGEKPRKKLNRTKENAVWLPSNPPVYNMEANCFPVFERNENKPDLS